MSKFLEIEFALHEPAMAIAQVFLALAKKGRGKLDVLFEFGGAELHWRGPDALGITEQSVLLALLSVASRQSYALSGTPEPKSLGAKLLPLMAIESTMEQQDLKVIKITWLHLVAAVGYSSFGGNNIAIVKAAIKRLAETTIWEKRDGKTYQSRVLAWIVGDDEVVTVVLNRRATNALSGGQFVKISLGERRQLDDDRSKCLHAWLSGSLRPGTTRTYVIDSLQRHVWGDVRVDTALRSRRMRLRGALQNIGALESWRCTFISKDKVEISRLPVGLIATK